MSSPKFVFRLIINKTLILKLSFNKTLSSAISIDCWTKISNYFCPLPYKQTLQLHKALAGKNSYVFTLA